jgi:hypothetical protein
MAVQNYTTPTGKLVVTGEPARIREKNIGTVANAYPGRLAVRENTDYDIKVSDGIGRPIGWIGFQGEFPGTDFQYSTGSISTINVVDTCAPVYSGGGFTIYMPGGLALGTRAVEGDLLFSWANGQVVPGVDLGGRYALKVPFTNTSGTTLVDTGIDFPAGMRITDCMLNVTTLNASGTLDVGFKNATESGDEDGLLDGEACAALGLTNHNLVDADAAKITVGVLLEEVEIKDATSVTPVFYGVPTGYVTDGTIKSLTYTPSNHAIAGDIYVFIESPGFVPVGRAGEAADATSAAVGVFVETLI